MPDQVAFTALTAGAVVMGQLRGCGYSAAQAQYAAAVTAVLVLAAAAREAERAVRRAGGQEPPP